MAAATSTADVELSPIDEAMQMHGSDDAASPLTAAPAPCSSALFPSLELQLTSPVVGRRHYAPQPSKQSTLTAYFSTTTNTTAASCSVNPLSSSNQAAGSPLMLLREPNNLRDPNAIKVLSPALPTPAIAAIGHLPARLAAILSPLLDLYALLVVSASVTYTPPSAEDTSSDELDPLSPHASLPAVGSLDQPMYASLVLSPNPLFLASEHAEYVDRIRRHVTDLHSYVEYSRADHTHRFVDNFALVSSSCMRRFPHLFTPDEQAVVQTFLSLSRPAQHLYCRLMARKQSPSALMAAVVAAVPSTVHASTASATCARWFQVSSLRYRQVEDVAAALAELKQPSKRQQETAAACKPEQVAAECDSDLPPLLTSPWKYATTGSAATYASLVPSSPFSVSKYPLPLSGDDASVEARSKGEAFGSANRLRVARKLQLQPVAEEGPRPSEATVSTSVPHIPGFVEASDSSSLSPSELWASLFDSMTVKQIKDFCARLDIKLRSNAASASSASTLKSTVLAMMQKQRTLSGRCMLDDPRILACVHSMYGQWVRLHTDFLTLCQRLYRLFFLSEDVSHSSIASAQSPIMLEDLGRAQWCKPVSQSPTSADDESTASVLFPSRDCFVSWDVSLQLMDVMSYALDDFEAELRAGYMSVPLALSCLEEGWERLQYERLHENDSCRLRWRVVDRLSAMKDVVTAAIKTAYLFPHDYEELLDQFIPHFATSSSSPPPAPASATPSFMLRFRASTSYASVCHYGVAVLERLHRYDEACCLLINLLRLPYCPVRRGEWWNRLSIDLATNLHHKKHAMAVCQRGMQDEHVRTGDRVELQRRWERLWKDRKGGNGEGLAPAVSSYYVPQPTTAARERKGMNGEKSGKTAEKRPADRRKGGKKRRFSTPATGPLEDEQRDDECSSEPLHRFSSSPSSSLSSSPSASPSSSPHHVLPASSCISQSTIQGRPTNREVGSKSRFFGYDGQMCSVEELALQYYARSSVEGGGGGGCWKGMHCENALFMSLFALLMWDVIFLPLPLVFPCMYQSAPLDMDDDSFYATRRSAITAHLQFLSSHSTLRDYVSRQWWLHYGKRCRGLNWRRWRVEELQEVTDCMGVPAVVGLLGLLARDYQHWSGGLPDLFLWRTDRELQEEERDEERQLGAGRPSRVRRKLDVRDGDVIVISSDDDEEERERHNKLQQQRQQQKQEQRRADVESDDDRRGNRGLAVRVGRVKLVEVKGPRDRLSAQQLAWLHVLAPFVSVEVCYVRENAET